MRRSPRRERNSKRRVPSVRQHDNPMHVVWHDHPLVQNESRHVIGQRAPRRRSNASGCAEMNDAVAYVAQDTRAILRDDRDEVRAGGCVVVSGQPDRPAASGPRVAWHGGGATVIAMRRPVVIASVDTEKPRAPRGGPIVPGRWRMPPPEQPCRADRDGSPA